MKKKVTLLIILSIIVFWLTLPLLGMTTKAPEIKKEEPKLEIPVFTDKDFGGDISAFQYANITINEAIEKHKQLEAEKAKKEEAKRKEEEKAKKRTNVKKVEAKKTTNKPKTPQSNKPQQQPKQQNAAVAKYVWNEFKKAGYSDNLAAGILGNMMVECGGCTLNLNYKIWNKSGHYGLCQFSKKYFPAHLMNSSYQHQVDYIINVWIKGDYVNAQNMTPENAAEWFRKNYERGGSAYSRKSCARKAYNYFSGNS